MVHFHKSPNVEQITWQPVPRKKVFIAQTRRGNGSYWGENLTGWVLNVPPHPPSEILQLNLKRLEVFDLKSSEQAKSLLIDAFLAEIISDYPKLKVWKTAGLETETLTGIADYLLAPRRAYLKTPFLCTVEAKRDDFEKGEVQCLAEMSVCQWNNKQNSIEFDVFGIVINGRCGSIIS